MGSRLCVCQCHFGDTDGGRDRSNRSIRIEQPTVSVVCVFTETDIAGDKEGREDLSQFLDSEDDGPIRVICWRAFVVLYGVISVRQLFQHETTETEMQPCYNSTGHQREERSPSLPRRAV